MAFKKNRTFEGHVDCILDAATDCFGEDIIYLSRHGGRLSVRAIFDTPYEQVDPDTEVPISSNSIALGVKLKDFNPHELKIGDHFLVRDCKYRLIETQEDGQGGGELILHRVGIV